MHWATFCVLVAVCGAWEIKLEPTADTNYILHMDESMEIFYNITDDSETGSFILSEMTSDDSEIVQVISGGNNNGTQGSFKLYGVFLGATDVHIKLGPSKKEVTTIRVLVTRRQRTIDKIFTISVAVLVSLIYINFGCAVNWASMATIIKRPIGPSIGLLGQFVFMPLLSYSLGLLFFPDRADIRLGFLFTGVSPAGGASNVWTYVLDGNIDLSVTMTMISTNSAFVMMPLWLFTLGPHVFADAQVAVPYMHIVTLAVALVVPLAIGYLIQRRLPRVSAFLVRVLKGFSALLIIFIIVFASVTNAYLFSLFTWRLAVAGLALPMSGYILGWTAAWIGRQNREDALAIAIETGIQNTGIAIFLLRFSLPQPQADLTTVVPVAIAMMTPLPLAFLYVIRRLRSSKQHKTLTNSSNTTEGRDLHI